MFVWRWCNVFCHVDALVWFFRRSGRQWDQEGGCHDLLGSTSVFAPHMCNATDSSLGEITDQFVLFVPHPPWYGLYVTFELDRWIAVFFLKHSVIWCRVCICHWICCFEWVPCLSTLSLYKFKKGTWCVRSFLSLFLCSFVTLASFSSLWPAFTLTVHINALYNESVHGREEHATWINSIPLKIATLLTLQTLKWAYTYTDVLIVSATSRYYSVLRRLARRTFWGRPLRYGMSVQVPIRF